MFLSANEKIVKEWDYAVGKNAGEKIKSSLVVTNKRIINVNQSNRGQAREEFNINDISSVKLIAKHRSKVPAILLIAVSLLLAVFMFVTLNDQLKGVDPEFVNFSTVFSTVFLRLLLPIVVLMIGVSMLHVTDQFSVEFCTLNPVSELGSFGILNRGRRKRLVKDVSKIKVNYGTAIDIVENINSLLIDIRENNIKEEIEGE